MIDRAGPERPHADTAVVDGVRHHVTIFDADETAGNLAHGVAPRPDHLEEGAAVLRQSGPERGPVAHLNVDVEVIIARPRRQAVILDPGALQAGGNPVRRGHRLKLEDARAEELLNERALTMDDRHTLPELPPVTGEFRRHLLPACGRNPGRSLLVAALEETAHQLPCPLKGEAVPRIRRHRLLKTALPAERFREGDFAQFRVEIPRRHRADFRRDRELQQKQSLLLLRKSNPERAGVAAAAEGDLDQPDVGAEFRLLQNTPLRERHLQPPRCQQ